jgi:hypothetical protein
MENKTVMAPVDVAVVSAEDDLADSILLLSS